LLILSRPFHFIDYLLTVFSVSHSERRLQYNRFPLYTHTSPSTANNSFDMSLIRAIDPRIIVDLTNDSVVDPIIVDLTNDPVVDLTNSSPSPFPSRLRGSHAQRRATSEAKAKKAKEQQKLGDERTATTLQARWDVEDKQAAKHAKMARQRTQNLKDQKKRIRKAVATAKHKAREIGRPKVRDAKEAAKVERDETIRRAAEAARKAF
jgi:hypothetical protein